MFDKKYDGLFAISEVKRKFKNPTGSVTTYNKPNSREHDLRNENIYSTNGELLEEASQGTYNTCFLLRLDRMYILDVEPFLEHHYQYTSDRKKYLDYVEFGMGYSPTLTEGIKNKIVDWCKSKKVPTWDINPKDPFENSTQFCWNIDTMFKNYEMHYRVHGTSKRPPKDFEIPDTYLIEHKSKVEIHAHVFGSSHGSKFLISHTQKIFAFMKRYHGLIKKYGLNHVENVRISKDFKENLQILCDHYSWLVMEILPSFQELNIVPIEVQHKVNEHWKKLYSDISVEKGEELKLPYQISIDPVKVQPEISKEEILKSQNNLIPGVDMNSVYDHFEVLITEPNSQGNYHLKTEQLNQFLYNTFCLCTPSQQTPNHIATKKEFRKVFFEFYQTFKNKELNEKRLKRKYFKILSESFEGFNENDYNDFHKT